MDTSKAKKNGAKKTEEKKQEALKIDSWDVSKVRVVGSKNGDMIFFTLMLNGISINNCKAVSGKNGDFIAMPQYKGSDGNYYNSVYAFLADEDQKLILEKVQAAIDAI